MIDEEALAKKHGAVMDEDALAAKHGAQPQSWSDRWLSSFDPRRVEALKALIDLGEGAKAGVVSAIRSGTELADMASGRPLMRKLAAQVDPKAHPTISGFLDRATADPLAQPDVKAFLDRESQAPDTVAGKVGKFGEQTLELLAPMGEVNAATKLMSAVPRIATRAAASGAMTGIQSGGDPYAMLMGALPVAALEGAGALVKAGTLPLIEKAFTNMPRPLSERAIAIAQRLGIPLTQGMLGGSRTVQTVEKTLGHTVAPDLYEPLLEKGQEGMVRGAKDFTGGFSTDRFAAGDSAAQKLFGRAKQLDTDSRAAYDDLHAFVEQDAKTIGTDTTAREMGKRVETVKYPVDLTGFQRDLSGVYGFIRNKLPALQRDSDPALVYLKELMENGPKMNAVQVEEYLSKFKELARGSKIPEIRDKAQGLAALAIRKLQPAIDQALSVNPDAQMALQFARQTWRKRSEAFELLESLTGDVSGQTGQVTAANRLLRPSDASFPKLQQVLKVAPEAADDLGKAAMADVFKKAQKGEVTNPAEAWNLWHQIGPRTKGALYTPKHVADVDAFLELAKRVNENPNPSNSGFVNALVKLGILITNPAKGAAVISLGRKAAQVLYTPEGAAAARAALSATTTPEVSAAMATLKAILSEAGQPAKKPPQ